jgi:flavin reductase (DIM6/NTAB) family NADH-FMN oxidoreductase RutF
MTGFDPATDLRRVGGRFVTGVTVVTAQHENEPCGLTVNSFATVSLEPPLLLVSISKKARAYRCIDAAGHFAVNVLSEDQEAISRLFASTAEGKFARLVYRPSPRGDPLLDGIIAWLDCEIVARYPGGTHTIFVGRVTALWAGEGRPLLFHSGTYTRLTR